MAISCEPSDLVAAAKCFCFDKKTESAVELYLLALLAGGSMDPSTLAQAAAAAGFMGIQDKRQIDGMRLYLMCEAASASGA
jgi:hypothetical protein